MIRDLAISGADTPVNIEMQFVFVKVLNQTNVIKQYSGENV